MCRPFFRVTYQCGLRRQLQPCRESSHRVNGRSTTLQTRMDLSGGAWLPDRQLTDSGGSNSARCTQIRHGLFNMLPFLTSPGSNLCCRTCSKRKNRKGVVAMLVFHFKLFLSRCSGNLPRFPYLQDNTDVCMLLTALKSCSS